MANETINSSVEEIISSEMIGVVVRDWIEQHNFIRPLMQEEQIIDGEGLSVTFPRMVKVTAAAKGTQAAAVAITELTTEEVIATASEAANISAEVFDITSRSTKQDMNEFVGRAFGRALDAKFKSDALALLAGGSNTVGTTTNALTMSVLLQAQTDLFINAEDFASEAVYILHPEGVEDVRQELLGGSGVSLAASLAAAQQKVANILGLDPTSKPLGTLVGDVHGTPVYQSNDVPSMNAGDDSGSALICVGPGAQALGCAIKWEPELESQRGIVNLKKSTIYYGSFCYAVVELDDNLLVTVVHARG
jgi:hypothetical protein